MFKVCFKFALWLMCSSAIAQTINPEQIRASSTNTWVLTTTGGITVWAPATGGGGGGGSPVGIGTIQTANFGASAFFSSGIINSDVFITIGGNNGIATANASSSCTNGCTMFIPPTSTSTESVWGTPSSNSLTHSGFIATNYQYGETLDLRYDPGPNSIFNLNQIGRTGIFDYCYGQQTQ